ncbi:juvenile hormone epoxide hydrolase 1-like [Diorhabda carinulata]|uniref:juvenile hormone epoxide hydrolase 1-like n=1 Tax=Diorhabda carinulata TaxID=1163345 RepID=UPI0025A2ED81|nr:juvenile hormone epoxide hydrolase 1-like [Diorhabda carinulata]
MGIFFKLSAIIIAISAILIFVFIKPIFEPANIPELKEKWWKIHKPAKVDTSIKPFKVQVSDEILQDLKDRLDRTLPFQAPLQGVNQNYGINTNLLKTVVDYWKTKYDWKKREQLLNQYPQFITNIQGLNIHYIHVKPAQTQGLKVLPLLLLHGWPGSVREFYEIIPLLTTPQKGRNFVFELIIPSLPGYGFSEAAEVGGLGVPEVAVIMKNLMERLNFKTYYVQGGDWGAMISTLMAVFYPEKVIGLHSNMCLVNSPLSNLKLMLGSFWPSLVVDEEHKDLVYPRLDKIMYLVLETGYMHLQATKPDSIGVALRDSPVGLAAYILEKFTVWTNPAWKDLEDGGLTKKFTMDQLLDNIMVYWVTRSITTSMRLYSESINKRVVGLNLESIPVEVPSGCSRFKYELAWFPESILKDKYKNLVHVTNHEGGHFAAFEVPEVLAKDIIDFTTKVESMNVKKSV